MRRWLLGIAGLIVVVVIALMLMPTSPRTPVPTPTQTARPLPPTSTPALTRPAVGQEAHLWTANGKEWYLAGTEVWQDAYTKALSANDTIGVQELIRQERLFPVASGTRLLVLEHYREMTKVRVMEGPQYGKAGWTAFEHIR